MKKVVLAVAVVLGFGLISNVLAVSLVDICKTATSLSAVKSAIEGGADVNEAAQDGTTALMAAAQNTSLSSTGIVAYLLSSGADVTSVNSLGKSAIDYAKENTKYGKQIASLLEKAKTTADNVKADVKATASNVKETATAVKTSAQTTANTIKESADKTSNEVKEAVAQADASAQNAVETASETKTEETSKIGSLVSKFKSWWNK